MKILHITETFAPVGGIETYVLKLLPLLEAHGHENVVIYRRQHPRTARADGRPVFNVPVTEDPQRDRQIITGIIHQHKPSLIYLHAVYDPVLVMEVTRLVPTVAYVHNFYPVCPGLAKYYRRGNAVCTRSFSLGCALMIYLRRCASARHPRNVVRVMRSTYAHKTAYQSLNRIVVGSTYMGNLLIQNGIRASRISILPPHFHEPSTLVAPQKEPPIVLFVGRLEIEKGFPYLLRALARVQVPCRLLVAGDGTRRPEYEELASSLDMAEEVDFIGWLDETGLHDAYQRATLLVITSIWPEPFGKVGIEALAHGRPVVAFNVGGIADWLRDGYNGFLVPPRDEERLAARVDMLLRDSALVAQLGANGRKHVEGNYSPRQHLDRLVSIFKMAANPSG